jgi:hypothetical protein
MNDQILSELKEYLQKNSKDYYMASMLNECRSIDLEDENITPKAKKLTPFLIDPMEHLILREGIKDEYAPPSPLSPRKLSSKPRTKSEIEEYLRKTKTSDTFSTRLLKYIDQTGLADAEIYKRAGIDRRHFSKIRCDKEYRPKKSTVVSLCLALMLEIEQVEELLKLAGYSLSNSDTGDLIVKFCIEKRMYDLMDVNYALEYFGVRALG